MICEISHNVAMRIMCDNSIRYLISDRAHGRHLYVVTHIMIKLMHQYYMMLCSNFSNFKDHHCLQTCYQLLKKDVDIRYFGKSFLN